MWLKLTNNGTYLIDTSKIKHREVRQNELIIYNKSGTKDIHTFPNNADPKTVDLFLSIAHNGNPLACDLTEGRIEPA